MRSLLATPLLLCLALGCSPREAAAPKPAPGIPDAWSVVDLRSTPADLPADGSPRPERTEPTTIRNRAVRALEIPPGTAAGWSLVPGDDAFLSFRPVPVGSCLFRVYVEEADGAWSEIWKRELSGEEDRTNLHAVVELDLGSPAGQPIELWLRIAGTPGCREAHWATPLVFSRRALPTPPARERPDLLFIGMDTLRTDVLGIYGREPTVTPSLDRFAAASDVYLRAFSTNNSTNPGFSSMMTGLHSRDHGIYDQRTRLPDDAETLAELLAANGYVTRGIVSARHLGRVSGIDQGFGELIFPGQQYFAETVVQQVLTWLQEDTEAEGDPSAPRAPRFTFLHLFDPHIPHNPPAPFDIGEVPRTPLAVRTPEDWFAYRETGPRPLGAQSPRGLEGHTDVYPADVAYLDRQLGRLFAFLSSRGVLEHTLVVLVADHGETLGEEGLYFDHGNLTDIVTHIPLIVRWPGQTEGRRLDGLVQNFDLFPTLLAAAGAAIPDHQAGQPLEGPGTRRVVVAEGTQNHAAMIRTDRWKLIETDHSIRLHDLRADPGETVDLAGTGLEIETELRETLHRWRRDRRPLSDASRVELSPEERTELEALGYLQ